MAYVGISLLPSTWIENRNAVSDPSIAKPVPTAFARVLYFAHKREPIAPIPKNANIAKKPASEIKKVLMGCGV